MMKKCWDHNPENRPTARKIHEYFETYQYRGDLIRSAETRRQRIINSKKYLSDTKNYKHHPESFYTSHLLNESIQQAESLLNFSSTDDDGVNKNNNKHHPESFYTNCPSNGLIQQVESLLNFSSTEIGSKPIILMIVMIIRKNQILYK